jgi:hypothetical protein
MFGHQDNQPAEKNDQPAKTDNPSDDTASTDKATLGQVSAVSGSTDATAAAATPPTTEGDTAWQRPRKALLHDQTDPKDDLISPAGGYPTALSSKEAQPFEPLPPPPVSLPDNPTPSLGSDDSSLKDATNDDLIHVKEEALDELLPLIDKLDQTPEEHFKTLMMIIQASDNHTLIEKSFQVAQTINDEKVRAQALLDIVNEINYFTQQPKV